MRQRALGVLALLAGSACASHKAETAAPAPADGATATQQASAPATRNRDIITRDELTKPSVVNMTVLDAIRSLRPSFLTVRGMQTIPGASDQESGKVHASIDGNKVVPLEELSAIRAGSVAEVRFLAPAAAMQRFGGTARNGPVILVETM